MTEPSEQAAKILGPLSGTAIVWSLDLGLRLGIFEQLVERPSGATAEEVANALDLDLQYTHVILRAAYAAEVLDLDDGRYRLAEHMSTLLLDSDAPGYLGGAVRTFVALRETYLDLRSFARTGAREWWSDFDPEWIDAVAENGQTYYRPAPEPGRSPTACGRRLPGTRGTVPRPRLRRVQGAGQGGRHLPAHDRDRGRRGRVHPGGGRAGDEGAGPGQPVPVRPFHA